MQINIEKTPNARSQVIAFRASKDEAESIQAHAHRVRMNVSDYVRHVSTAGSTARMVEAIIDERLAMALAKIDERNDVMNVRQAAFEAALERHQATVANLRGDIEAILDRKLAENSEAFDASARSLFEGLRRLLSDEAE